MAGPGMLLPVDWKGRNLQTLQGRGLSIFLIKTEN